MKFADLLSTSFSKEKPALVFLLKLLILSWLVKCIFFFYNTDIASGWSTLSLTDGLQLFKWSAYYDLLTLVALNFPFFIIVGILNKSLQIKAFRIPITVVFALINLLYFLLNGLDIFYYRFHLQRADADLFYVLRNPGGYGGISIYILLAGILIISGVLFYWLYKQLGKIVIARGDRFPFTLASLFMFCLCIALFFRKTLVPTYPLTSIKPVLLPVVQNSLHTFAFSVYRSTQLALPASQYLSVADQEKRISIDKKNDSAVSYPKNVVLFIMESVPMEFFDTASPYKVAMPFLDSLVQMSTLYRNAFSYAYSSNKGITALLAGIPTLTDIPLYHSPFTAIKRTAIGAALATKGYRSSFFIGDNYDDFGFAQFCKWSGIQSYYSMEDIPNYKTMEQHTMGLHDEYVLPFMLEQLNKTREPFFATQYNISTHFPYDIPSSFHDDFPVKNNTPQMKTMAYYSKCLQRFFQEAKSQTWFNNTVFIFCSDHWAQPDGKNISIDDLESFRIPLFIYDPENPAAKQVNATVSQLDVMNTILYYGGYSDSITSYGTSLKNNILDSNRTVFTKTNTAIYQAINRQYLLGFDAMQGKPVYCYDYKKDAEKKVNLLQQPHFTGADEIILEMKAFLQTAVHHYRNIR